VCRAVDLIRSLNEDEPIWGLTTLNNELYVRYEGKDITVYDTQTYNVQRTLQIPRLGAVKDMTSCIRHQCIYIADHGNNVIHRVEKEKPVTQWPVNDKPHGLSVNSAYNVLVTCDEVGKIKEFTTDGQLVREINLQSDIVV
jgi:DNA-binding beta-propeller fold protein YncE